MLNKITIALCLLCSTNFLLAQNNTKSVYSSYGLGELQMQEGNGLKGLSGSSMGLIPGTFPSLGNPLGIAGRERVDFDFGFEFNNRLQQTNTAQRSDWAGNVNHVSLAYNVWHKKFIMRDSSGKEIRKIPLKYNQMLGVAPYTAVDYNYAIEGDTNTYKSLLSVGGNGGINSIYWNHAIQVFDTTFSLGFSAQRLFGSITTSRLKNILSDSNSIGYQQTIDQRIKGNRFSLSAAHSAKIDSGGKFRQTISAQYTFSSNLTSNTNIMLRTVEDFFAVKDTISTSNPSGNITLPSAMRFGYGLQKENNWAVSLDFQLSDFTQFKNTLDSSQLLGMQRASIGFLLNPDRARTSNKKLEWYKKVEWSAGLFYQTGPYAVKINNDLTSVNEYGISFGVGLPMIRRTKYGPTASYVYLSTQYSQRGNVTNGLIKEDIFRINLAMNLSDIWFKGFNYN